MSALNRLPSVRIGFDSHNLSRRLRHVDLHAEPLEFRRLLSAGPVAAVAGATPSHSFGDGARVVPVILVAPPASVGTFSPPPTITAVANPTMAVQANLPTDNSSTTNTPGVSPTIPAPPNVVTDDSASVATSSTSAITALLPPTSPFTASSLDPVFLVPMPGDPETVQLSIETPGLPVTSSSVTLQLTSSAVTLHAINSPVGVPPITSPLGTQAINSPAAAGQNQPSPSSLHIGQGLETELQKSVKPELGPQPDAVPLHDGVKPLEPLEPAAPDKTEAPKTEAPKTEPSMDATRPPKQAPPQQVAPPVWWLPLQVPVPIPISTPAHGGIAPAAPGGSSPKATQSSMNPHTGLSTLFGAVAVVGGGYQLAMGESKRFGMSWLPSRIASPRSARPRTAAR